MNAVIIVPVPAEITKTIYDHLGMEKLYLCNRATILRGVKNDRPQIESLLKNIGPSTAIVGKFKITDGNLVLTVHSPTFEHMRDALSDLYLLRAFPTSPAICISHQINSLDGIDVSKFEGMTFDVNHLTISDDHAWYEDDYELPVTPKPIVVRGEECSSATDISDFGGKTAQEWAKKDVKHKEI